MYTEFEQIWRAALEGYLASLKPKEIHKIEAVTSQQSLLEQAKELQKRYGERRITRRLEQVNPFLKTLHSFSEVVKIFLQSDPTVSALVWGSIYFVLEVGVMFQTLLCSGGFRG
jgi:folylpolyglutamate synthase/dihydropteroate synthase